VDSPARGVSPVTKAREPRALPCGHPIAGAESVSVGETNRLKCATCRRRYVRNPDTNAHIRFFRVGLAGRGDTARGAPA